MLERFYRLSRSLAPFAWQEIDEGILPALYAAVSPDAEGGSVLRPTRSAGNGGRRCRLGQDPRPRQKRSRLPQAVGDFRGTHRGDIPDAELTGHRRSAATTVVAMSDKASAVPESSVVVRPEPIDSENYSVTTRLQAAGLRPAIELFEQAADAVPLPRPPQPIVIADYGASTGHNSLLPISAALPVLRNRLCPEHSVLVVHTDVPDNNFTVLFQTLAEDPDTYLDKDAATFASAVGRSFYSQIIPSNSVHLGWSSWAIQWLSRVPAPTPRPRARGLQCRRSGAGGIRQAGRARLARVRRIPRSYSALAVGWW